MSRFDRDTILAQLRAEDVAAHLGIRGTFRGAWLRSARCAETDHNSDAFGLRRDGMWHCWSCDKGGDLLRLLALGSSLDMTSDFPKVLEIAAGIAGVQAEDDFAAVPPRPRERPPLPKQPPIADRIALAKRRAAWVWDHLYDDGRLVAAYLSSRGLDPASVFLREPLRNTPLRIARPGEDARDDLRRLWWTMNPLAIVVPVRSVDDGRFVDLRARRVEPTDDQPKIIGMLGGITSAPADQGHVRRLIGCYGKPHCIDSDHVVIVEGAPDYLTALEVFPNAQVLGAVEAGSVSLVAAHAARELARHAGDGGRLTIVEQYDPPRTLKDGTVVAGAADQGINEDPNAAAKVAARILGPRRVGQLPCAAGGVKDLNDLWCAIRSSSVIQAMTIWWEGELSPVDPT